MDVPEVDFLEKEETMDEPMTNCIIRTQVIDGLASYQMFEFYSIFGLRDPSFGGISLMKMHTKCLNHDERREKTLIKKLSKKLLKNQCLQL